MRTNNHIKFVVVILFSVTACLRGIFAQGTTAFTYQGYLAQGANAANGRYDLLFALYDAPTDGNQIGVALTNASVSVSNGLFTTMLDFGAGMFNGSPYWLAFGVRGNAGEDFTLLNPRQALAPTPYALHAANASTATRVGGLSAANFWQLNGNADTAAGGGWLGTTDNQPLEFKVNGVTSLVMYPTSSGIPTIIAGAGNGLDGQYSISRGCIVSGGTGNRLSHGPFSPVRYAVISGGESNGVGGWHNTIAGGNENSISGLAEGSVIGGGSLNVIRIYAQRSVIGGGLANQMEGRNADYCTIAGGAYNTILPRPAGDPSTGATIGGGINNTNSSDYGGTIVGGSENYIGARSLASTISGGQENVVNDDAQYATVPGGIQAAARSYGQMARASGQFSEKGDAQTSVFTCRSTTTDATQTELFLDGASRRMRLSENSTWTFDILITARTSTANSSGYQIRGVIENNAGSTTLVGTINKTVLAEDNTAWDVTALADDANDALVVRVTGGGTVTVRWVASVRTVEVIH